MQIKAARENIYRVMNAVSEKFRFLYILLDSRKKYKVIISSIHAFDE